MKYFIGLSIALAVSFLVVSQPSQHEGAEPLFPAYRDGKWGYISQTGSVVIPPRFAWAGDFGGEFACVGVSQSGFHTSTFINSRGEMLLPPQFTSCRSFSEGRGAFALETDKTRHNCMDCDPFYHWGYVDTTGKIVIAAQFHSAAEFSEGLAAVENDAGKWGFIDKTGRTVVEFRFEYADSFSEGLARVVSHRKYGYINHQGKNAVRPQFPGASKFSEGLAAVRTSGQYDPPRPWMSVGREGAKRGADWGHTRWEYIVKGGRVQIQLEAEFVGDFSEGLAAFEVMKPDGYLYCGYLDRTGKPAIQPRFGGCEDFSEGLGLVLLDGKWHFINRSGDIVLSPPNSQVGSFRNGLAAVSGNGYIDKTGKTIWPPDQPCRCLPCRCLFSFFSQFCFHSTR